MPSVDPRFIYPLSFRNRKTGRIETRPDLNADGYLDYAHQIGLVSVESELLRYTTETADDGGMVRWATVRVTVVVGNITATGLSCTSNRDRFVKEPGYEVAVAETRALKRALAIAANVTEKVINPSGTVPTREIVDVPLEEPQEPERKIPDELKKSPDDISGADQFEV